MSRNRKPVLIVVTSEACTHCITYRKNTRNNVNKDLQDQVDLVEIHNKSWNFENSNKYHPELQIYIKWYPMFILADDSWYDHKSKLNIKVMNGEMKYNDKEGKEVMTPGGGPAFTEANIVDWVKKTSSSMKSNSNSNGNSRRQEAIIVNNGVPVNVPSPPRTTPFYGQNNGSVVNYVPTAGSMGNIRFAPSDTDQ